jgi:hypothetical protein
MNFTIPRLPPPRPYKNDSLPSADGHQSFSHHQLAATRIHHPPRWLPPIHRRHCSTQSFKRQAPTQNYCWVSPPTLPPPPSHATDTVELVWYRVFRNGEAGQGEQLAAREATELGINMFVTPEMCGVERVCKWAGWNSSVEVETAHIGGRGHIPTREPTMFVHATALFIVEYNPIPPRTTSDRTHTFY